MRNDKISIRKVIARLNNPDDNGGFWLPNIQRPFVWSELQIERLFDSVMREYPISTLLAWETDSSIKTRKFIDNYKKKINLTDFNTPPNNKKKILILDGQQRLQSLYIALKGSYEKKELYFYSTSGEVVAPDDIKYKFKFLANKDGIFPWIKVKDLVFSTELPYDIADKIKKQENLDDDSTRIIGRNISKLHKLFCSEENIVYQLLDSIDQPDLYKEDDVVEVFIRANSGGTPLSKSDLLYSLLATNWDEADEQIEDLLQELNREGYEFSRDFILKACLTILDKGSKYEVSKFRKEGMIQEIIENWQQISQSIKDVKDFLFGKTFIRSGKALTSYQPLIPIIYFRYHYPKKWQSLKDLDDYILRTMIAGAFTGTADTLLDACVKDIKISGEFNVIRLYNLIKQSGKNLEVTQDSIINEQYNSSKLHLILNLLYKDFNYHPAFKNNNPQVDHIFPYSILRNIKMKDPNTGRPILKYKVDDRDQIANLMLLTREENGGGGKSDTPPEDWFRDKSKEYLERHCIPGNRALWSIEKYEDFIEERKKLILNKLGYLILQADSNY